LTDQNSPASRDENSAMLELRRLANEGKEPRPFPAPAMPYYPLEWYEAQLKLPTPMAPIFAILLSSVQVKKQNRICNRVRAR